MTTPDAGAFRAPDRRMIDFTGRPGPALTSSASEAGDAGVRPFIMTGGRTVPSDERLRIETQVVAMAVEPSARFTTEQRHIVAHCVTPISIAELSAALHLPIGVVRVLVADLAAAGHLNVHVPADPTSRQVIERILDRVHGL